MSNRLIWALLLPLLLAATLCESPAAIVREIRVERRGLAPVDDASVLAFTSVKVGDDIGRGELARDIRTLQRSGRFSYVAADVENVPGGVAVVYTVQGKPRIRRFEVDGATDISNKKVRELLELGVGDLVDDATLATRALKVKEHYQKRYYPYANLTWTIEEEPQTGTAIVKVKVDEGRRANVRRLDFTGNKSVKARALRKPMKQRRWNIFSWITGAGTYKPDDLETDLDVIRRVYLDRGYLDVRVGEPVIKPLDRKNIAVTIPITEGPQYRLGNIQLDGTAVFPAADVQQAVTNKTQDVASLAAIERTAQSIRDFYGGRGYIGSQVKYQLNPQAEAPVVDVNYNIQEGKLAYIRNINIRGNTRTKDKVIRRELPVYPGEIFNEVKVRTGERRLKNLGYFSFVNSVSEPTREPDQYDLVYEVQDQRTGQFLIGAGYSSVDNVVGFAELSQGNFDIGSWPPTGGGQKLKLRGTLGTERRDVELSFIEPWFLDRRLSLGLSLFQRSASYYSNEYDQQNTGARISLGKPLTSFDRINLIYGIENIRVYDVDEDASAQIKEEEGSRLKSYVTLELVHDSRDSAFVPTRGNRSSIAGTLAGGPFGGETDIYGFEAQASQFWPVWFDHVFNLKAWSAVVDSYGDMDRVPIFDRLFLGGARTLRGFRFRHVGPKDETGEPVGGKTAWYATAEYTIPIVDKVRFATFYDIGMVLEDSYDFDFSDYNSDWGIGLRLDFPGFPLRLDYAWPIATDEFNDRKSGRFQFSIGYVF